MNRDQFFGKWHELKGKVKEKWGKLTDDDIAMINGKWDQLSGKLQQKYGWAREQAEREINHWCASCEQRKGCKEERGVRRGGENRCGECHPSGKKEPHGYHKEECGGCHPQGHQNERHEKKHPGKDNDYKKRKAG